MRIRETELTLRTNPRYWVVHWYDCKTKRSTGFMTYRKPNRKTLEKLRRQAHFDLAFREEIGAP